MPGPQLSGKRPLTLTPRAEQSPAPTVALGRYYHIPRKNASATFSGVNSG